MSYFSKVSLVDDQDNEIEGTMLKQLKIAESNRLAGGIWNGTRLDPNYNTSTLSNGATYTVLNSMLTLSTSTTSGSSGKILSTELARYDGAKSNYWRGVFRFDEGTVNNVRSIGCADKATPTNKLTFQLSNTTFGVASMIAGTETLVNSGDFNRTGDRSGGTYILDDIFHTFEIFYTNHKAMFVIDSVPIHTVIATLTPTTGTKHFKTYMSNINTGVGSAVGLYSLSSSISSLGKTATQPKNYFHQGLTAGVNLKVGPGCVHNLNLSGILENSVVTIYDNTTAAGTVLYTTGTMKIGNDNQLPQTINFDVGGGPLQFINGLTLAITTAASNCLVMYE